MQVTWNEEDTDILKREWDMGTPSSIIARLLTTSRTRNSIIGKAHREKLAFRKENTGLLAQQAKEENARLLAESLTPNKVRKRMDKHEIEKLLDGGDKFKPLKSNGVRHVGELGCKWPVGTDMLADDYFCGLERRNESCSYCRIHAMLAYQPAKAGNGSTFALRYIRG